MTPGARIGAAITVLDRIVGGQPAEQALTGWARANRYAGSGDRAAVRDHVFGALRCRSSYLALSGQTELTGRALMIGAAREAGAEPSMLFSGTGYAPAPLSEAEQAALATAPSWPDLPEEVRLDCPGWLIPDLRAALGEAFAPVMMLCRDRAPVFLRVNRRKATPKAAGAALAGDGVITQLEPACDGALRILENGSKINGSRAYLEGLVELQDLSSQMAVAGLALTNGMDVLDYCAGGGGKVLAMAARVNGRFVAHDAAPARMADLPARAARAGVRVATMETAALSGRQFDFVLVDAPCSGSGTWRRTPDAKWRLTPARLDELTALQDRILSDAATLVRPGGRLAYMTCSLLDRENEGRVGAFLARTPGFRLESAQRFTPETGGDGFYAAQMSRA